jgi:hypothetical protein
MVTLRRKVSRLLAVWAVRVDPDPPLTFTTARRIDLDYAALATAIGGSTGLGRDYPGPSGTVARY